jgi:glycosyltransferase involved in cell wall biosynthesis
MSKPKLSIIIPTFNSARTVSEAVSSCFRQNLKENMITFEIIMVDDGSKDTTPEFLRKIASEHKEIKIFFHTQNKGGGATRNTAISKSSGDVIFCLDSDDILPDGTLSRMYLFMEDKKKRGLICDGVGLHRSIKFKGKFRGIDKKYIDRIDTFSYSGERIPFESLLQINNVLCPLYSVFMHTKEAFTLSGGYPENHGFDTQAFAWRFLASGLVAYTCPDAEYYHRLHPRGFYASYYTREARSGRSNRNWFRILTEFLYLFDPEVKKFILSFNLNNEGDLFNLVSRCFDPLFVGDYNTQLVSCEKRRLSDKLSAYEIESIKKQIESPALKLKFYTPYIKKVKKILKPYYIFIYDIKTRLGIKHQISITMNYILLCAKQIIRIDFAEDCSLVKNSKEKIDIFIKTVYWDRAIMKVMLQSLEKNVCNNLGDVYIVSKTEEDLIHFCNQKGYHFIDEKSVLGYDKDHIKYEVNGKDRSGWVFQQIIKFAGDKFVKTRRYLVVDSDTILINPHIFLEGNNNDKVVFRYNTEWHDAYFKSFKKLFGYDAPTRLSFTSHMMLFDVEYLAEMKREIENKNGKTWDEAYIDLADPKEASSMSDYDTYANWVLYNHPENVVTRPLYNTGLSRSHFNSLEKLTKRYSNKYKTVSFHNWMKS